MTEITLSNPSNYAFLGLFTVFYLISVISILLSKKKTHPIDALPVNSIKKHPHYQAFINEDEERQHIYKDELPAEFSIWLIAHTTKSKH